MSRPFLLLISLTLLFTACSSPEERAERLFDQGKYEEVIAKYPAQPIAKNAREKIAEKLLAEGKYEDILQKYADTPASSEATNKIREKQYNDSLLAEPPRAYPNSPPIGGAREWFAQQLYDSGRFDDLIRKYPSCRAAAKAWAEMAKAKLDSIRVLKRSERIPALQEFLSDHRFDSTESALKAQQELNKLSK